MICPVHGSGSCVPEPGVEPGLPKLRGYSALSGPSLTSGGSVMRMLTRIISFHGNLLVIVGRIPRIELGQPGPRPSALPLCYTRHVRGFQYTSFTWDQVQEQTISTAVVGEGIDPSSLLCKSRALPLSYPTVVMSFTFLCRQQRTGKLFLRVIRRQITHRAFFTCAAGFPR